MRSVFNRRCLEMMENATTRTLNNFSVVLADHCALQVRPLKQKQQVARGSLEAFCLGDSAGARHSDSARQGRIPLGFPPW